MKNCLNDDRNPRPVRISCLLVALAAVGFLLVASERAANAQVVLYDNLDNVRFDDDWLSVLGPDRQYAQQFLTGENATIDSVTAKFQRTGDGPTGSVGFELWRDNGSNEPLPVGDANAKIADIGTIGDVTELPIGTWEDVTFNNLTLDLDPNMPYWIVADFSQLSGIRGERRSVGWAATIDVPRPTPPDYDAAAGTNGAAFSYLYRDANPDWVDATKAFGIDAHFFAMSVEAVPNLREPTLRAGDADQDLDFDQVDLVQVQVAAKYLTGQGATWGEGDWNNAPGGEPGNPPAGDGLFNQFDIIAAQQAGVYLAGPYAAIQGSGVTGDAQASVIYNADTGEVAVDAPAGVDLTSINIDSAGGIFTGDASSNLSGSVDNDADENIFKATFGGSFGSVSFGNAAQTGLSEEFVLGDLSVAGSLAGGGELGNVDLVYVPEPSTLGLLAFGVLFGLRRFRST